MTIKFERNFSDVFVTIRVSGLEILQNDSPERMAALIDYECETARKTLVRELITSYPNGFLNSIAEYTPAKDASETAKFTLAVQNQPTAGTAITELRNAPVQLV